MRTIEGPSKTSDKRLCKKGFPFLRSVSYLGESLPTSVPSYVSEMLSHKSRAVWVLLCEAQRWTITSTPLEHLSCIHVLLMDLKKMEPDKGLLGLSLCPVGLV